jgi:hypothetical protein
MQQDQSGTVKRLNAGLASKNLAWAEANALKAELEEQAAYEQFDSLRTALSACGKAHEATQRPEFHRWMSSREITDSAWGRWALAIEASHADAAQAPSP